MLDVVEIITFKLWLRGLCDRAAVARTNAHPRIVSLCSIGGTRTAGGDRSEMRFHHEFGYRLYFLRDGATVVVPYGGDKTNQQRDIERGARLARRPRGKERSTHAMEGSGNTRAPAKTCACTWTRAQTRTQAIAATTAPPFGILREHRL